MCFSHCCEISPTLLVIRSRATRERNDSHEHTRGTLVFSLVYFPWFVRSMEVWMKAAMKVKYFDPCVKFSDCPYYYFELLFFSPQKAKLSCDWFPLNFFALTFIHEQERSRGMKIKSCLFALTDDLVGCTSSWCYGVESNKLINMWRALFNSRSQTFRTFLFFSDKYTKRIWVFVYIKLFMLSRKLKVKMKVPTKQLHNLTKRERWPLSSVRYLRLPLLELEQNLHSFYSFKFILKLISRQMLSKWWE